MEERCSLVLLNNIKINKGHGKEECGIFFSLLVLLNIIRKINYK
jgi:hypothetical protein